ncbi:MAG: LAGLIDADG family homing endonuclease, partial [Chitinophagales bacterium]
FERFLNPERVSMPDIDIDFDDEGRQRVIDYVVEKYGQKQVAQIITYGSMKAKSALRDVGRVMNIPLQEVSIVAKTFPDNLKASLAKVLAEGDVDKKLKVSLNADELQKAHEFRKLAEGNLPVAQMIRAAKKLEGSVRNTGVHACGVVITPDDVTKYVPVSMAKDNDLYISQFDNSVAEDAGLLKMDFLGLKTLTIIKDAVQMIEENHGVKLDIDEVPLDDIKTYELFQRGETVGIFQYESAGMQKYMKELKPTAFNDLIAMNALYRPGPLEYIPNFINRKHGREEIVYDLDAMEEYLHETYGICVTGDTLVFNPKTGERTRLDEITDHSETFEVQGVDSDLNTKFAKVSYWVCNGKKEVLEVKLRNGSKVRLTPDHRVLTENGWQEIGDLQVGDSIATPRKLEVIEGKEYDKTALKVLAEQQIIPEFVFSLKEELIAFFVGELWGNGGFSETSKIAYATDSEKFAFDLQTLLLRLGVAAIVEKTVEGYKIVVEEFDRQTTTLTQYSDINTLCHSNSQDSYRMTKKGEAFPKKSVSFCKNLVNNINKRCVGQISEKNQTIHWQEITSIEAVGKELVYDITVEDIHNFVGNNIILHNCVYQEQVMLLSQKLANFSKGE